MFARRLLADPGLPRTNPTTSYWQQHYDQNLSDIRSPTLPQHRDVVIIGSGITGCSSAVRLLEDQNETGDMNTNKSTSQPFSLTILEARGLCSGATGRNGGHVKFNAVSEYAAHKSQLGHEAAAHLVDFCMAHFQAIKSTAERLGALEVGEMRGVTAITSIMDPAKLDDARAAFRDFQGAFPNFKPSFSFVEGGEEVEKRFGISGAVAAIVGPAGAAWPYRLITGIFKSLLRTYQDRFSIETHTPALDIQRDGDASYPYSIHTPRGIIRARHVIHCTEAHSSHLLPCLRGIIWPVKGQMAVLSPGKLLAKYRGEYSWSFLFPGFFDYATQNARTGEIFIGGGDGNTEGQGFPQMATVSDDVEIEMNKIHLSGVLPVVFNNQEPDDETSKLKVSWTGLMGFSIDGYPILGKLPEQALTRPAGTRTSGCEWIAAGFGGYGMVNSWLSGSAVVEILLTGKAPQALPPRYLMNPARYSALEKILESKITAGTVTGTSFRALM
ncbi:hypothetical protein IFR05_001651 [Cadophora sp. M221]|nr:hypothetical protein IFR05_001651 [Cadophora sp. M221]